MGLYGIEKLYGINEIYGIDWSYSVNGLYSINRWYRIKSLYSIKKPYNKRRQHMGRRGSRAYAAFFVRAVFAIGRQSIFFSHRKQNRICGCVLSECLWLPPLPDKIRFVYIKIVVDPDFFKILSSNGDCPCHSIPPFRRFTVFACGAQIGCL